MWAEWCYWCGRGEAERPRGHTTEQIVTDTFAVVHIYFDVEAGCFFFLFFIILLSIWFGFV